MEIKNNKMILDIEEDYEFVNLIVHIKQLGYGDATLKVQSGRPYQLVKPQKSVLLSQQPLGGHSGAKGVTGAS